MKKILSDSSSVIGYQNFQRVISQLSLGDKVQLKLQTKENGYEDVFVITEFGEAGQIFSENGGELKPYFTPQYRIDAYVKKLLDKGNEQQSIVIGYDVFEADHQTPPPIPAQNIVTPQNPTPAQNPPVVPHKKTSGCLIVLYVLLACIVGVIFLNFLFRACTPDYKSTESTGDLNDSIEVSIDGKVGKSGVDSSKIKELKNLFTIKKDEFQEASWVKPKSRPIYSNTNGFYCYFAQDKQGNVSNFRFVGQYAAEDWIFFRKVTFNIDGKNIEYFPENIKTDHDTTIWEWYDDDVNNSTQQILNKIAQAKTVKVRFHGTTYYDDKVMSQANIKSIKNTLDYYKALGGSF